MLKTVIQKIFGSKQDKDLKKLRPMLEEVNKFESSLREFTDEKLKLQTEKFRNLIADGKSLEIILPEAFATAREASRRVLGMRPFDVQILGGIALHQGRIAEMKTGEGKTLCATLPLYLNALSGKGAHLVTVNDYLATRDASEMGVLYNWLGLTVGVIVADMEDEERQNAYKADITYGTNNEFAFDYLRDNMKFDLADYVQRDHNFCIVDEVDSILIDEARTPLLISGSSEGDTSLYGAANQIIPQLEKGEDYKVDEKAGTVVLTDPGVVKVQKILGVSNLFEMQHVTMLHHINQALKAHSLFTLDVDYVVKNDQVIIVDEFTGRLKEGSRWSDGLHQSVEAKEGVPVKNENQTLASITFQNYFRLYNKLAGMTGTAETEAEEFEKIYSLDVVVVPTNLPMVRDDMPDVIYKDRESKYRSVSKLIKEVHAKGQPILVGTISIETSEIISKLLDSEKVPHEVLNAKQHDREAQIVANAGQPKSVTIATNMAGRGTDIKLTKETKDVGGLFILGTERHESRRIDNQLRGRSGRQGDPGASKFFLSLEDDLMRIFGSDRIKKLMERMGFEEDEPIEHKMITNAIAKAQKKVESHNFEIRKHLLDYDNVMNEQRKVIYRLRRDILNNYETDTLIEHMLEDVCDFIIQTYKPSGKAELHQWPWKELQDSFQAFFKFDFILDEHDCQTHYDSDPRDYISKTAKRLLEEKLTKYDDEQVLGAKREMLLSIFDHYWKDHLLNMDHLKEGINLRAYAQKDPLNEYKRESFDLFEQMKFDIKKTVIENLCGMELYTAEEIEELKRQQEEALKAQLDAHRRAKEAEERRAPITRTGNKVGRNNPCPCGSGKKFKHCHGA